MSLASTRGDDSVPLSEPSAVARPPCSIASKSAGRNPFRRRSCTARSRFADCALTRPVRVECGRLARSRSTETSAARLVSPSSAPRDCTLQRPRSPVASAVAIVARGAAASRTAIWTRPPSDSGPGTDPGHVRSATSVSGDGTGSADVLVTAASRRAFSTLASARRELEPSPSPTTRRALPFTFARERAARNVVSIDRQLRAGPAAGRRHDGVSDLLPLKACDSAVEAGDGMIERPADGARGVELSLERRRVRQPFLKLAERDPRVVLPVEIAAADVEVRGPADRRHRRLHRDRRERQRRSGQ